MKLVSLFLAAVFVVAVTLHSVLAEPASAAGPTLAPAQPTVQPAVQVGACDEPVPCPGPGLTGACGVIPASQGVFSTNTEIDLGVVGAYDPVRWVVVLDYERFEILPNVTVTFRNHPKNPPVVIKSRCPIVIAGTLLLDGEVGNQGGQPRRFAKPGPGGFWGGMGGILVAGSTAYSTAGHGPGGGFLDSNSISSNNGGNASFVTQGAFLDAAPGHPYGVQGLVSLVGGSGGAGGNCPGAVNAGGGGGGGALLLGSDVSIDLRSGRISSRGGNGGSQSSCAGGGGSGGYVRLFAPTILAQSAVVDVGGGSLGGGGFWLAGAGRIQIEANSAQLSNITFLPSGSTPPLSTLGEFFPTAPPVVELVSWRRAGIQSWSQSIPLDPTGMTPNAVLADVSVPSQGQHELRVRGLGIPQNTPIEVRLTYTRGQAQYIPSTLSLPASEPGDPIGSFYAVVPVDFQLGVSTVQVRAML